MYRLLLFAVTATVISTLQWLETLRDHEVVVVCAGSDIVLPWNFTLSHGEVVEQITWVYQADGRADEDIALLTRGHFVVMPAFSGRVSWTGDGSIVVKHAPLLESGNYSIIIAVEVAGQPLARSQRIAFVQVAEPPATDDGLLHVHQTSQAVYDNTTGQWRLQLTCGNFQNLGHPAEEVVWKTPSGQNLASDSFQNGTFYLLVPNPPSDGNYTCSLPTLSPATRCLPAHSPLSVGASARVDEVKAAFVLLEARNQEILARLESEKAENNNLKAALAQIVSENAQLQNKTTFLQTQIDGLKSHVAFTAQLSNGAFYSGGSGIKVIWDHVVLNEGNGYDNHTGIFTAPVSGDYMFAVSTRSSSAGSGDADIMVQTGTSGTSTVLVCRLDSNAVNDAGACIGIAHLFRGRQAWVQTFESSTAYANSYANTFAGFLISSDL